MRRSEPLENEQEVLDRGRNGRVPLKVTLKKDGFDSIHKEET